MNIKLICVGSIKETFYRDAINEYLKRMTPFANIQILEVQEYRLPHKPSNAQIEDGLAKEAEAMMKHIHALDKVIVLDRLGKMVTSEDLSIELEKDMTMGRSTFAYIIGSSYGLSEIIQKRANELMSLSHMTFPHQLVRLILLEQLYRAFKIMNHETYHK
jgi:23S rRNA (pseudouridine1915-N3)-methyltransferase